MTVHHDNRMRQNLLSALGLANNKGNFVWESTSSTSSACDSKTGGTTIPPTGQEESRKTVVSSDMVAVSSKGDDGNVRRIVDEDIVVVAKNQEGDKKNECPLPPTHTEEAQELLVLEEPLKYNPANDAEERQHTEEVDEQPNKRQKTNSGTTTKQQQRRKRCVFNETVRVVPIPPRTEYSNRVRNRIWSNSTEIQENAARNTIEFASEGWDWRAVLLDEAMHHCTTTGELIHPIHYEPHAFIHDPSAAADTSSCSDDSTSSGSSDVSADIITTTTAATTITCTNNTD